MIGPDHHVGNIVKSVWRVDVVTTWRAPDSDLGIFCQKAVDALRRGMQRGVRQPMLLRIPEMDAGLIAHLDLDIEACQPAPQFPDHRVLGLPRGVGIEIENIVVGDAIIQRAHGLHIPRGLHQASRDDPRIRQRQPKQLIRNGFIDRIAKCCGEEVFFIHDNS